MSQQQPEPDRTPRPNRILASPDTVEQCRTECRTPAQQTAAAGAARNQFAETRMSAANGTTVKGGRR